MRHWSISMPISSLLLRSSTFHKPTIISHKSFSTVSTKNPSLSNEPPHSNDHKNANDDHSITSFPQSNVVNALLSLKNKPFSALAYFKWVDKVPGFSGDMDSFCVLFHMFMGCNHQRPLVRELVSCLRRPDGALVTQALIESANKFGFPLSDHVYRSLVNGFVGIHRLDEAMACFNVIVDITSINFGVSFGNILLKDLVNENRIKEAEELCGKMFDRGISGDTATISAMMEACQKEGRIEEAVEWFRTAKEMGIELSEKTYNLALGIVCKKGDADAACKLLMEMKNKGWVPSARTYMKVIKACLKQGRTMEASRVKEEMVAGGKLRNEKGVLCFR